MLELTLILEFEVLKHLEPPRTSLKVILFFRWGFKGFINSFQGLSLPSP